jgi:hypothetical protein
MWACVRAAPPWECPLAGAVRYGWECPLAGAVADDCTPIHWLITFLLPFAIAICCPPLIAMEHPSMHFTLDHLQCALTAARHTTARQKPVSPARQANTPAAAPARHALRERMQPRPARRRAPAARRGPAPTQGAQAVVRGVQMPELMRHLHGLMSTAREGRGGIGPSCGAVDWQLTESWLAQTPLQ